MTKYRLTVSGTVEFHEDGRDRDIEELLKGLHGGERFERAIQTLEEDATDTAVTMEEVQ